jgi:hypothetical protein
MRGAWELRTEVREFARVEISSSGSEGMSAILDVALERSREKFKSLIKWKFRNDLIYLW